MLGWIESGASMVCCVVAALFVVVLHRLMPSRAASDDGGFAPPAVRRAGARTPVAPTVVWIERRRALTAWSLRAGAATVAVGLLFVAAAIATGLVADTGSTLLWVLRSVLSVGVATAALLVSLRIRRTGCDGSTTGEITGAALIGTGAAVLAFLTVDMHLLHLYHLHDPGAHLVIHGGGLLAVFAGFLLVAPRGLPSTPPVAARTTVPT